MHRLGCEASDDRNRSGHRSNRREYFRCYCRHEWQVRVCAFSNPAATGLREVPRQSGQRRLTVHGYVTRSKAALSRTSIPDHDQAVGARLAAPRLARPPEHLAHIGVALVAREGLVGLGLGIEALNGIGDPVGGPDPILVVDVDRIGAGLAAAASDNSARSCSPGRSARSRRPARSSPTARPWNPTRRGAARPRLRRLDHRHRAGRGVDLGDVVAGKRCIPDVAGRRRGDAVGPAALR